MFARMLRSKWFLVPAGLLIAFVMTDMMVFIFVRPFVIPSNSMANTLLAGDHFFVSRSAGAVKHGDIVSFRPPHSPKQFFVKRVIGLPGDRIEIAADGVVRNGVKLEESYAVYTPERHNRSAEGETIVVPAGMYYLMGDNRDNSFDSRNWGPVPAANIIGRPLFIYWSVDEHRHTRWERTFRRI